MINFVYIPVILLMALIITTPSKITEDISVNLSNEEQKAINIQRESDDPKADFKAIRSFIRSKLDLESYLLNNDSYTFFNKINSLIKIGPTGTNVADIQITIIN